MGLANGVAAAEANDEGEQDQAQRCAGGRDEVMNQVGVDNGAAGHSGATAMAVAGAGVTLC